LNSKLRELEKLSGLDIYGLGLDRAKWEAAIEKYTELVIKECGFYLLENGKADTMDIIDMEDHFKGK
jgi:hypothetical protein